MWGRLTLTESIGHARHCSTLYIMISSHQQFCAGSAIIISISHRGNWAQRMHIKWKSPHVSSWPSHSPNSWSLCQSAQATVTNTTGWGLAQQTFISLSSGGWRSRSKCRHMRCLVETLLAWGWPPSHCVLGWQGSQALLFHLFFVLILLSGMQHDDVLFLYTVKWSPQ